MLSCLSLSVKQQMQARLIQHVWLLTIPFDGSNHPYKPNNKGGLLNLLLQSSFEPFGPSISNLYTKFHGSTELNDLQETLKILPTTLLMVRLLSKSQEIFWCSLTWKPSHGAHIPTTGGLSSKQLKRHLCHHLWHTWSLWLDILNSRPHNSDKKNLFNANVFSTL